MSLDRKPEDSKSTYERVMVAAREARRLNDRYSRRGLTPPKKVTSEAMERVDEGEVEYEVEEESPEKSIPDEETH